MSLNALRITIVGFLSVFEMLKLVSIISVLLLGSVLMGRAQQTSSANVPVTDKTEIIEAVLDLEMRNRHSFADFDNITDVSSENIEFIDPSQLSKRGFTLVAANQLCEWQANRVVQYLLFKMISAGDDVIDVAVSHVTGGRACFSGRFYSERKYKYEARRTSGGWTVQLTRKPIPPFFSGRKRFNAGSGTP
ncbi:MAG TPA: hypothetical protein VK557_12020 [Pyrinomonadaceae bacterium]|nr:hypothetical protein [Pyrinomonadaceae bacterium]